MERRPGRPHPFHPRRRGHPAAEVRAPAAGPADLPRGDSNEAERHLSRLLRRVAAGEEIVICRSGLPIIRLVPFEQTRDRGLGRDRGLFEVTDDFDEPLPDDLVDAFEA
ncbi:MAG: type II toxin-antitoxin system Phd/YefM family antitoxin [Euzebyaceae bacterium]|nr:type II toxin-antitoxin system Phd/YefM family antitoxin [Euzebyaceae bacterium]